MILEWKEKADGFVYGVLALCTLGSGRLALGAKPNPPLYLFRCVCFLRALLEALQQQEVIEIQPGR